MKRKNRLTAVIVVVSLLIFLFLTMVMPSILQNRAIKQYLGTVLIIMQHQKLNLLVKAYNPSGLPNSYLHQLNNSKLLGWQITHIDSQPYPMETGDGKVAVDLDLFYQLPAYMLQPNGPYQVRDYPPYGQCTKYHAVCHLYYEKQLRYFIIDSPNPDAEKDLLVPMPSREHWDDSPVLSPLTLRRS